MTDTTGRNIVILCDGTGNEISENISNVLKLYRCLRKTAKTQPRQFVYYDPGVGTLAQPSTWHRIRANISLVLGLATGYGLDANVLAAYQFLVNHWQEGDRIYLFGFSRGAYTGLVIVGGRLDILGIASLCSEGGIDGMCAEIEIGQFPARRPAADPRFAAVVLADPEFGRTFTLGGLKDVKAPIQLWASERGGDGVLPEDNETIYENLPTPPEYRIVPNSGHFAFIVPCSAEAAKALPEICADAGTFDRRAFHKEFNLDVVAFFRRQLIER